MGSTYYFVLKAMFWIVVGTGLGCEPIPAADHDDSGAPPTFDEGAIPSEPAMDAKTRRTPAEWEPQESVWLQWPQSYEGRRVERAFVEIVHVVAQYEDVHLIAANDATKRRGEQALVAVNTTRVTWHIIANDNSWMRDNGPRYVELDGELILQNWEFDGWGGGFGRVPYAADNAVPNKVAGLLQLPVEHVDIIHERGDLEVNGADTALVSWSVLSQRNPGRSQAEITKGLQGALGVTSVIYTEGFDPLDGTRGHVDGMARFVSADTIVVGEDGSLLMDQVAEQIAAQRPDVKVERMPIAEGASTLNWLVGDGFVLTGSSGDPDADAAARVQIAAYFPDRDIHFANIDALWENGGGVHCVTNDVPQR